MRNKAVFIDKDGTLIENAPYNIDLPRVKLYPDALLSLKVLKTFGFEIIVITNQSGVSRGFYKKSEVVKVGKYIKALTTNLIDGFYFCPHQESDLCSCRKPSAGLIFKAAEKHRIDLNRSWFIGDILDDIEAGKIAGCKTVLINRGTETIWKLSEERVPHFLVEDLKEAVYQIVRDEKNDFSNGGFYENNY